MKLYRTHSNADVHLNNLYRVTILDLGIIRWSDETLRYMKGSGLSWDCTSIPKGTTTPDFWSVK